MTQRRRETLEDWIAQADAYGWKRRGNEWVGPCPLCGGTDRFHFKAGTRGQEVIGGCGPERAGCNKPLYPDIAQVVFGETAPAAQNPPAAQRKDAAPPQEPPKPRPLPNGPTDTPSFYRWADGSIAYVSVRHDRPGRPKRFSQWTPYDLERGLWMPENLLESRPLYRLAEIIDADKVVIVEGEKCVHAYLDAWPDRAVTTFGGGTGGWKLTDYTPLAGKEVLVIADDDSPLDKQGRRKKITGQSVMRELAAVLHGLGCAVKTAIPETFADDDIADWIAQGKAYAAAKVKDLMADYPPPEGAILDSDIPITKETPRAGDNGPGYTGELASNEYFEVEGLEGTHIVFFLRASQQYKVISDKAIQQADELTTIAPDEAWWQQRTGEDQLTKAKARRLGHTLIKAAQSKGQYDRSKAIGRGAFRAPGNRVLYHLGDRLLENGQELPLQMLGGRRTIGGEPIELVESATDAELKAFAEAVLEYRWRTQQDGKRLLGWMVGAIVGGALPWRQHLQITAPSGQGKSWLLREVVEGLLGPLLTRIADASSAALARLTGHSSLVFAFDEAEPTAPWMAEVLDMMRISSGGEGKRVRVNNNTGGVDVQEYRFSALLSNVASPVMSRADASRLTNIALGEEVEDWVAVEQGITEAVKAAPRIRSRIIREAAEIVVKADAKRREYQLLGVDSREAHASGVLTACWHWWGVNTEEDVDSHEGGERGRAEALDLLNAIMSIPVHFPGGPAHPLVKVISRDFVKNTTTADAYAVKYTAEGLLIGYERPGQLRRELRNTPWEKANLKALLLQVPGAADTKNTRRMGGAGRQRCVLIPPATLDSLGIEIGGDIDADAD